MARPPRRAAVRKPSGAPAGQAAPAAVVDAVPGAAVAVEEASPFDRDAILAEFESALREQPGVGQEGLDFLMSHLRDAVDKASLQPARVELDPSAWMATLDAIIGDALDETERNTLVRQLNEAIEPLKDSGTQVALEFAKRLQSDGQAAALAWLDEQRSAVQDEASSPPPVQHNAVPPGRQAITRSRSRRLRGPPA